MLTVMMSHKQLAQVWHFILDTIYSHWHPYYLVFDVSPFPHCIDKVRLNIKEESYINGYDVAI